MFPLHEGAIMAFSIENDQKTFGLRPTRHLFSPGDGVERT
jgi:hypothetical protein